MTTLWKKGTKQAYYGYVANLILGLISGWISAILAIVSAGSALTGNVEGLATASAIALTISIIGIAATLYYLIGISSMKKAAASTALATGTNRLFIGAILAICASVLELLPVISIVGSILAFVAFIIIWTGYSQIKNNATNANAQSGGAKLSKSALLSLIAILVALIPLIGAIAGIVLEIIAIVFAIKGWKSLANSELE